MPLMKANRPRHFGRRSPGPSSAPPAPEPEKAQSAPEPKKATAKKK